MSGRELVLFLDAVNCAAVREVRGEQLKAPHRDGAVAKHPAVAKERGVSNIIVIDSVESRLELASEFGADSTINLNEFKTPDERIQRVKQLDFII